MGPKAYGVTELMLDNGREPVMRSCRATWRPDVNGPGAVAERSRRR